MRLCAWLLATLALLLGSAQAASATAQDAEAPLRSSVALKGERQLSFLEWGAADKPVLLLLHGKASNAAESATFAAALARRFHVFAVDTRGCGFSSRAIDGDYTVESTVDDLEQLVAAMHWGRFTVYGHSLGAVMGIAYAAKNPAHARLLIIEDGGPTTLVDGSLPMLNPGQGNAAGAPAPRPAEQVFASWAEMVAAQPTERGLPTPLMLEARFVRSADGTVRSRTDVQGWWKTARGAAFTHPWPLVRALQTPTLLIRADRGLLPEPIAMEMVRANPVIGYVTVRNSGHGVHFDHPDEVLSIVATFWAQHADAN